MTKKMLENLTDRDNSLSPSIITGIVAFITGISLCVYSTMTSKSLIGCEVCFAYAAAALGISATMESLVNGFRGKAK